MACWIWIDTTGYGCFSELIEFFMKIQNFSLSWLPYQKWKQESTKEEAGTLIVKRSEGGMRTPFSLNKFLESYLQIVREKMDGRPDIDGIDFGQHRERCGQIINRRPKFRLWSNAGSMTNKHRVDYHGQDLIYLAQKLGNFRVVLIHRLLRKIEVADMWGLPPSWSGWWRSLLLRVGEPTSSEVLLSLVQPYFPHSI